jgi:hypothetical protein
MKYDVLRQERKINYLIFLSKSSGKYIAMRMRWVTGYCITKNFLIPKGYLVLLRLWSLRDSDIMRRTERERNLHGILVKN